jgi:hypothetical protein
MRTVTLREERDRRESRHLWAYLDETGALHIDGQDLGPGTAPMSDHGEYEWFQIIKTEHLPRLLGLLGGHPGDDILSLLEEKWSGARSYDLEKILRETAIPIERHWC